MVSITLSSVIAVSVLGVLLVKALEASGFVETLKGRGL
jgi:hypothetical protein